MAQLIKLQLRRFWLQTRCSLVYLVLVLGSIGVTVYRLRFYYLATGEAVDLPYFFLNPTLKMGYLVFIVFLFIGYEYMAEIVRVEAWEAVGVSKKGVLAFLSSSLLVLTLAVALLFVVFASINLALAAHLNLLDLSLFLYLLALLSFYFLLNPLLACLLGLGFALNFSRRQSYLLLLLLSYLCSSIGASLVQALNPMSQGFDLIRRVYLVFNLFPIGVDVLPLSFFLYPLLPNQLELWLAWLLIALFLLARVLWRHSVRGRKAAYLLIILSVINIVLYYRPASLVSYDRFALNDSSYYQQLSPEAETANFTITALEAELALGRELKAEARVELDCNNNSSLDFTLYHGYRLSSVTDQDGLSLPFAQSGDYIKVQTTAANKVKQLRFKYQGSSANYYANWQGACLPGNFAYLPRAGRLKLYDNDIRGFLSTSYERPIPLSIKLKSGREVFCNLPTVGSNHFQGVATHCTLASGFFQEMELEGLRVIYPYLDKSTANKAYLQSILQKAKVDGVIDAGVKSFFLMRGCTDLGSVYEQLVVLPDCLITSEVFLSNLKTSFATQQVAPDKQRLLYWIKKYERSRTEFYYDLRLYHEEVAAQESVLNKDLGYLFELENMFNRFSSAKVRTMVWKYLQNERDSRTVTEFFAEAAKMPPDPSAEIKHYPLRKLPLLEMYESYLSDPNYFVMQVNLAKRNISEAESDSRHSPAEREYIINQYRRGVWLFADRLASLGEQELLRLCTAYLEDEHDQRYSYEFLLSLPGTEVELPSTAEWER